MKPQLAIHDSLTENSSPGAKESRHPDKSNNIIIHDPNNADVSLTLGANHDQEVAPDVEQNDSAKDKEGPDSNATYDRV